MDKATYIGQIRDHLKVQPPLTVTTTRKIHEALLSDDGKPLYHTLREAVQKVSLGSNTAVRRKTQEFFAMYLNVSELEPAAERSDLILTLPGIEKRFISYMASSYINSIKSKFASIYGEEVVAYWISSTQLRSVTLISPSQTRAVVARDNGRCRICKYIEKVFGEKRIPIPPDLTWILHPVKKPRICHIISRRAVFWYELEQVRFHYNLDIFSKQGVVTFKELMRNPLHSRADYMVYLCRTHDNLVQQALQL